MTDPRAPTTDETELLDFVDRTGKDVAPLGPPGVWHDFGEGLGDAAMQGLARTGRAAAVAGAVPAIAFDKLNGDTTAQDWYFENVVDPTSDAVDAWTPNAAHVGAAGQALNGLTSALIPLAVGGGNPVPLLGTVALDTPVDLLDKGASLGSSIGVAGIQTLATAAGFKLPAAWGSNLLSRLATGAGGNLAIGAASRDLSGRALDAGGNPDLADQYRGDATAAVLDVGMGLAFGALAHAQAPKVTRAQRDAVLTTNNAHHFENETAPGTPADQASAAAHVTALETAVRQLLDGESVNLADAIPDAGLAFVPRAQASGAALGALEEGMAPAAAGGAYDAFRVALESGGRADAAATTSGALGRDQFIPSTWRAVVAKAKPAWAQGLTDAQLLAARTDPVKSAEMEQVLRAENATALESAGLPADTINLYAAHHFGPGKAVAFARASDDTPMAQILTPGQIKANPYLKGLTKGETIANWTRRAGNAGVRTAFGTPDEATQAAFVQRAREHAVSEDVARALAPRAPRDDVTGFFDARQSGIKTSEIERAQAFVESTGETAHFVSADVANLGGLNAHFGDRASEANVHYRAMAQIVQAELSATGADVVPMRTGGDEFGAVIVNASDATVAAALRSADAKIADYAQEHGLSGILNPKRSTEQGVGIHMGAAPIRPGIPVAEILNRADDGVNLSKTRGTGHGARSTARTDGAPAPQGRPRGAGEGIGAPDRGVRREVSSAAVREPQRAGNPPRAGDGGRPEPGNGGEVTPDSFATAANDAVAEFPDLLIADADGNARPASEFLQDIQATTAQAEVHARAIDTAVNCFLRSGT